MMVRQDDSRPHPGKTRGQLHPLRSCPFEEKRTYALPVCVRDVPLLNGVLDLCLQIRREIIVAFEAGNIECAIVRSKLGADVYELFGGYAAPGAMC